jgi:hypothetical protein
MAATGNHIGDIPLHSLPDSATGYPPSTSGESTKPLLSQTAQANGEQLAEDGSANPKQLITREFHLSTLEWLIHLASIIFTIAVLYLCGAEVYFLDITKSNINSILNTFQFVAAFHAIIIGISMGAMAVYHLQYELCAADGLPFGYVLSPFQLGSPQMFLKPGFWKAAFAKTNTARIYFFGAGIFVVTVIQALMNPSSAILIVPQLDWWKVNQPFGGTNGFTYINVSQSDMRPSHIDGSMVPEVCDGSYLIDIPKRCPYADMVAITNWGKEYLNQFSPPNITASTNANMVRYLGGSKYYDERGYSIVTTGMNHITRALGDIWLYATRHPRVPMQHYGRPKITVSTQDYAQPIMRPLVQTQCAPPQDITDLDEIYEASFPADQLIPSSGQTFAPSLSHKVNISISRTYSPAVNFVDLSEAAGKPFLGALVGMNFRHARDLSFSRDTASGLIACTIAPYWVPTNMSADPNIDNVAILDYPKPFDVVNSTELMSRARPIELDLSYAQLVNIRLPSLFINVLEHELRPLAIFSSPKYQHQYDGSWKLRWSWVAATLLSMQLSDALARIKTLTPMMTFCERCADQTYDPGKSIVQDLSVQNSPYSGKKKLASSADEFANEIKSQPDLYMPVQWTVQRYGYGWGLKRATEWFAAIVILLHTLLVLAHLLTVSVRRWHFEGWDDLWGFVALLNKTPPLRMLEGLAIGEPDNKVHEITVMVRESDKRSQAVFTSSTDTKKLEPGREYS